MIKIAIVDDRPQNRNSIKEQLVFSGDVSILFLAQNGLDFLEQMAALKVADRPQVVLMDIEMPVLDGIAAVNRASVLYTDTKYLMLTVFDDYDKIFDAIKAGASGYLLKDEKTAKILEALHQVVEDGGAPMSPSIARKALNLLANDVPLPSKPNGDSDELKVLSAREAEILKYLVDGLDYKDVAEKIFLSPHTIRKHIANIYTKLHVTNRSQVVRLAVKKKWFMMF